jgi:hypothetical protein
MSEFGTGACEQSQAPFASGGQRSGIFGPFAVIAHADIGGRQISPALDQPAALHPTSGLK